MSQNLLEILLVGTATDDLILHALHICYPDIPVEAVADTSQALDFLFGTGSYAMRAFYGAPNVILLNLSLPYDDASLQLISVYARTQAVPILAFVGSEEEQRILDNYTSGINGYIQKTLDLERLCETIEEILPQWLVTHPEPLADYSKVQIKARSEK